MSRAAATVVFAILTIWLVAHVLYIGPVEDATEITVVWGLGFMAASLVAAAVVLLATAIFLGRTQPAWLRFVRLARSSAAVLGCALIVLGLLYYRETEPHGEVGWIVLGMAVLAAAGGVHWWLLREERREWS